MKLYDKFKISISLSSLNLKKSDDNSFEIGNLIEEETKRKSEKFDLSKTKLLRSDSFQISTNKNLNEDSNYYIDILKHEANRLKTFKNWNISFIQPLDLAQAGFFYLNKNDNVQCIYCQLKLWNWSNEDIPILIHFKLSPKCRFLNGYNVNNISNTNFNPVTSLKLFINNKYEFKGFDEYFMNKLNLLNEKDQIQNMNSLILRFDQVSDEIDKKKKYFNTFSPKKLNFESFKKLCYLMKRYENRLLSYSLNKWPHPLIKTDELALSGFFFTGKGDNVVCPYCTICVWSWTSTDNPLLEHYFKSKNCSFLKEEEIFSQLKNRLYSFQNWNHEFPNPKVLANNGFFYTGENDCVKCHLCKVYLSDWQSNDDPLTEHKKYSKECIYTK